MDKHKFKYFIFILIYNSLTSKFENKMIDHTTLWNIGTNTYTQLDSFLSLFNFNNSLIHQAIICTGTQWVTADIDHVVYLLNKGTNTHAQIDTFIGLFNITSPSNLQVLKYDSSS